MSVAHADCSGALTSTYNVTSSFMFFCLFLRKEQRSKQGQTNNKARKARQHSTPKAVTFPKKNELPRVGLEPMTLYTLDRALYH